MPIYNFFTEDYSCLADPRGKILTSIKCRKTPNAPLVEKTAEAKDGLNTMVKKVSYP